MTKWNLLFKTRLNKTISINNSIKALRFLRRKVQIGLGDKITVT